MKPKPVSAQVVEVKPGLESAPGATVIIRFENPAARDAKVSSYTLTWSGGSKNATPEQVVIPAGKTLTRSLAVGSDSGNIEALLKAPGDARVEVTASP